MEKSSVGDRSGGGRCEYRGKEGGSFWGEGAVPYADWCDNTNPYMN